MAAHAERWPPDPRQHTATSPAPELGQDHLGQCNGGAAGVAGANLLSRSSIRLVYLVTSEITCDNWWRHTWGTLSPCRAPGSRHRRGRGRWKRSLCHRQGLRRQLRGTAHPTSSELCPAAGAASRNPDHVAGFLPLRRRQGQRACGQGRGPGRPWSIREASVTQSGQGGRWLEPVGRGVCQARVWMPPKGAPTASAGGGLGQRRGARPTPGCAP